MMSPHNYTRFSWSLAIAAFIIIVAACFAPWLFSKHGNIDFEATGEIGDSIGGTMSPFVGRTAQGVVPLSTTMRL